MAKNIVVFCDGTWNSSLDEEYGVPASTNVYRLYQACLDRAESDGQQFVWYQPGVGALGSKLRRTFEGATGTGVSANIRRGYMAVARHYEPGDRIFLFGFSRGAFTARSIAGMIRQVGLLQDPTAQKVAHAYRYYSHTRFKPDLFQSEQYRDNEVVRHPDLEFETCLSRIHYIGVWDTVGSLGFSFWGWSFNLLQFFHNGFHDLSPNQVTDHVYHALAMDELRTSFMPTLWEIKPTELSAPHLEQVWFRGVHSDVGGGYTEDRRLADITLRWMADCATSHGLLLRQNALNNLNPDPTGRIHRSLRGPLYTNIGGWPRWYPFTSSSGTKNGSVAARGYLHPSVEERDTLCAGNGSKELPLRTLKRGESCTVEVPADQLWTNTGLVLEQEGTYDFTPSGWWQKRNETPVGPEGLIVSAESRSRRLMRWALRVPEQPWMHLIGLINHPREWPWRERPLWEVLRYLIWEDPAALVADLFAIRPKVPRTIEAGKTGVLWVFANDLWKKHIHNSGTICLQVTRIS